MSPFAIIIFLTLGVTAFAGYPKFDDLYEALDTNEKLYIIQRSYEREPTDNKIHKCAYAQRKFLSTELYQFTKHFRADNEGTNLDLFAYPIPEAGPSDEPKLHVHKKEGTKGRVYTMRYWDRDTSCAIFTFSNEDGRTECEIYMRERKTDGNPPHACDIEYDRLCARKYYVQSRCE